MKSAFKCITTQSSPKVELTCNFSWLKFILYLEPAFQKYSKDGLMHEAGFDAYITGVAFVGMCYFE